MTAGATTTPSPEGDERGVQIRIHEAMEKCKGNHIAAAKLLGMTAKDLMECITDNEVLRLRWSKRETPIAPDDIDTLTRQPITTDEERLAAAYAEESKRLRRNLLALPLNPKQVSTAIALRDLNKHNFKDLMQISNASMTMTGIILNERLTEIQERLRDVVKVLRAEGSEMTEERVALAQEEKSLSDQLIGTAAEICRVQRYSVEGAKILAVIQYKLKTGTEKKAKPSFQPIDVQEAS